LFVPPPKPPIDLPHLLIYLHSTMELSQAQLEAVRYLGGPQIILAGAGSGKTRVILAKASYLIKDKGYSPDSIFIITYSSKTQAELEERFERMAPELSAQNAMPAIRTFHSFGLDLLSEFGHLLGLPGDVTKTGEHRLWQFLKRAIGELPESDLLDTNKPNDIYYQIKSFIDRAKDELVTPDAVISRAEAELSKLPNGNDDDTVLLRDKWGRVLEAGKIYQSYERIKSGDGGKSGGIDYGDMIVLAHRLLSGDGIVGASVRKRCRYVLVDEFQDANYAQVEILRLMTGPTCGVTVVGDDDQAIYRFRGASFASFKLFQRLFPGWKVFRLEENYRSQANIVKAAQGLIEVDPQARFDPGKKMAAGIPANARVIVRKCADDYTEAASVAAEIEKLLQNHEYKKPSSIAVIFRARRHKDMLVRILQRRGIEFYYDKTVSEIASPQAEILMALYDYIVDRSRVELLPSIISHFVPGMSPQLEREINYKISRAQSDPISILESTENDKIPPLMRDLASLLRRFETLLDRSPIQLLERIAFDAGIMASVIQNGRVTDHRAAAEISEILKTAERFQEEYQPATHASFLEYLDWRQAAGGENEQVAEITAPLVLQTVHGSKGLEYPAVFIIGLSGKRFPTSKRHSLLEFPPELYKDELPEGDFHIQEERRLFYVAMTRARELLYLYGVEKKGIKISQFVSELQKSPVFAEVAVSENIGAMEPEFDSRIGAARVRSDTPGTPLIRVPVDNLSGALLELWKIQRASAKTPDEFQKLKSDFLSQIDTGLDSLRKIISADQFGIPEPPWRYKIDNISQSNIEDYRACPLRFYFGKVLNLPSPSNPNMILGLVIHSILEEAGRALREKRAMPLDELIAAFEKRWSGISLDDPDRKERLRQRGHDILERFVRVQETKPGLPLELEKPFSIPLQDTEGNEVANLVGRIDRIDTLQDGLEIIDYKTGKQPKNSKNDLQLPIYSMACRDLFGRYPSAVTYMYLGDDDPLVSETCDPARIDEIKSEIMEIIDEINSSEFVATRGFVCNGCSFARICPARQE